MLCDKSCDYCRYSTLVCDPADEHLFTACDYIGTTGHKRPCKAGRSCKVRIKISAPKSADRRDDTERKRAYRAHVSRSLGGLQAAAILAFMEQEGYTVRTLSERLVVSQNTVRTWLSESAFANWRDLAAIGLPKPDGMPTSETHPMNRK